MSFQCSACKTKSLSYQGYKTHLRLSQNPECRKLFQHLFSYIPSDSGSDTDNEGDEDDDDDSDFEGIPQVPFEGDYFGANYLPEHFGQGLDRDDESDVAVERDGELADDEDVEAMERIALDQVPEPPRNAPSSRPYYTPEDEESVVEPSPPTTRQVIEERLRKDIVVESFPSVLAGAPIHQHRQTNDSNYTNRISDSERNPYAPFTSKLEWEVARWAKLRGPGSTAITELLQIEGFCNHLGLTFSTSNELNRLIHSLPSRPRFHREEVTIAGETFEFFYRDIRECIRALWGGPDFAPYLVFAPERHYRDQARSIRLYHDMHTGDWWWETQEEFEKSHPGATVVPIIISSDKTQVTLFRNKAAYPVYMTIGNLPKFIRRKPSRFAQILIAYLPTTKLTHIKVKASRRRVLANLFHTCMSFVLDPLVPAGEEGMNLVSGDGAVRRGFPVYALFVGDYPEQLLVTSLKNGQCPIGDVEKDELGDLEVPCIPRDISLFCSQHQAENIFWRHFPHTNIYLSIAPDILHQLLQGVIKHVFSWLKQSFGHEEIDARCRRLPPNHSIRIFANGITHLSRITGTEHAQLCQFILGIIIDMRLPNGLSSVRLIRCVRAVLDFLYLAQYPVHSSETLDSLEDALCRFHENKQIFVDLGIREHFNIPKLHFCRHYRTLIERFGTTDNCNTKYTERLHIDTTKDAYAATNHKDEYCQMTVWLERKEKVVHHERYIHRRLTGSIIPSTFALTTLRHPPILVPHRELHMAKYPSVSAVLFQRLVSDYGAKDFEYTLGEYVAQAQAPHQHFSAAALRMATHRILQFVPFWKVAVYHRIKFTENDPYSITKGPEYIVDAVHAEPNRKDKYGQVVPGRFDTVLVNTQGEASPGVRGYRVGQVRCVFTLPKAALKEWFPTPEVQPAKYLAYVEWFTPFKRGPEANHLMYKVSHAFRPGENARLASVVPVDLIRRSVHLFPRFGSHAPQDWKSSNVLELCDTFYLNDFLDRSTYATVY
ncbi:hypothetical protein VNI00_016675 [Paramarasmius palmivorus]|uniref:Uncharacterized protein n=1 Tax=Paramarasmius palmivorus TaxID=297713 RepID=A0AAW0BB20_9AGAR